MPPTKKSKTAAAAVSVTNKQQRDVSIKSPLDHWSFLDEIEAPMWIDLNSEATGTLHENDDEWFLMTHQFHQCSSRQLISAFSHSGEVCTNSVSGRKEPCSPKLPSSVSKSRGKHFKSIVWAQSKCTFATKQHPVKSINSKLSGVTSEGVKKVKSRLEIDLVTKCDLLPEGVVCENSITETAGSSTSTMTTGFHHTKTFSGATVSREGEKSSISTITSESTERNEKSLEVATQVSDQPNKLLSSLRTSLRKSCGTRPATKTDINRVRRSVGTKSSSSKSSVGSSSHPGHDGNNMTSRGTLHNDKTPDSRNAMGIYQAPKNILKGPNLSKASPVVPEISSGPRQNIQTAVRKSINQETLKAKVQSRPVRPKVLLPQSERTLGSDSLIASRAKGKVQVSEQRKRCPTTGKENGLETMTTRKNSLARGITEVKSQVQKTTKERNPVKKDVGKQVFLKKNTNCRNGQETTAGMIQKLYLR
ncbi:hypothetical protein POM88_010309 [Heracleum sosnowskyi]|uniref:Uncharacterized protein n=1 Tax=Heracleum sosnowskyi TaxID=360622 RepID=A0AAD8IU55_9APIA|nr:hypothetical protein POM88_010309 [Heracleum sosnowskyi]